MPKYSQIQDVRRADVVGIDVPIVGSVAIIEEAIVQFLVRLEGHGDEQFEICCSNDWRGMIPAVGDNVAHRLVGMTVREGMAAIQATYDKIDLSGKSLP